MNFDGILTPVVTPLDDSQAVDHKRLGETLEFLVGAGVDGLLLGGTTGEYYALTPEERVETLKFAHSAVGGRKPLIFGTGAPRTGLSVELAEAARKHGADAILVATSEYGLPTQEENAAHALRVDQAAGLPVMLYNFPSRTGAEMGRDYLARVTRSPNFRAIKESSGSIDKLHLLVRRFPGLRIACGRDDQALEYYAWGSASWVCAGSNFAPEAHRMLHDACVREADFTKARRIMAAMLPLMEYRRTCGKFVQCIKEGMAMRGIPVGPPRSPLQPLNDAEKEELRDIVTEMDRTLAAIRAEAEKAS